MKKNIALFSGTLLAATLASGCFVDIDDDSVGTGDLTVGWTVEGTTDPEACYYWGEGVTNFELEVEDRGGWVVARKYAACEDFQMTLLDLPEGTYTGFATLVTPDNDPLTTTLPLDDLRIYEDTELEVSVDFPPSSFLF